MVKEITINPNGDPFLIANVRMVCQPPLDVLITYDFIYWSARKPERKKLIIEHGNNLQDHDDHFRLMNPDNASEGLTAHENRIVHVEVIINGIKSNKADYEIALEIYQTNDLNIEGKTPIDSVKTSGKIGLDDGDVFETLRAIIKI